MNFHHRQYDPQIGRFLSVDPLAVATKSFSSYAAMNNNPASTVDPVGLTGIGIISWVGYAPTLMDRLLCMAPSAIMEMLGMVDDVSEHNEHMAAAAQGREQMRDDQQNQAVQAAEAATRFSFGTTNCNKLSFGGSSANEVYGFGRSEGGQDPQSGQGSKREHPKGMDPVKSDDPKKSSSGERVYSLEEFAEYNKGLSYKEIINQRPEHGGGAGGPELRYVKNPIDGNIMDMRHVLVVGYGYGIAIGRVVEAAQWLT